MIDPIVHSSEPVLLVGGAYCDSATLNKLQKLASTVVAADGGADQCLAAGLSPKAVIGDLDSISAATRARWADRLHYVDDPDTTDFEKALTRIRTPLVIAAGFLGGRLDHMMAALGTLSRHPLPDVVLASNEDACFVARSGLTLLSLPRATRIAFWPLTTARVTTLGLRWNLTDAPMQAITAISTSNETVAPDVRFDHSGPLMITVPAAQLPAVLSAVRGG